MLFPFLYTCLFIPVWHFPDLECTSVSMTHQSIAIHSLNKLICNKLTNVLTKPVSKQLSVLYKYRPLSGNNRQAFSHPLKFSV